MMKCLSKFKSKTFRRGTSLLEVLVASGVIATGVAVILPSVGNIRESSRSLTCKDHLRTLGQAHLSYSLDHMNRFAGRKELAGNHPGWYSYSWISILNEDYFGDAPVGDFAGNFSWLPANNGTIRWVTNNFDGSHIKNQIWCPSMRTYGNDSARCYPMNRYAARGTSPHGHEDTENTLEIIRSGDRHPKFKRVILGVKTSKYKNPANSVLHHEAISANDWTGSESGNGLPLLLMDVYPVQVPGAANTYGVITAGTGIIPWDFRHNLRMNTLFMDGRVATEAYGTEGLNAAERYRYEN